MRTSETTAAIGAALAAALPELSNPPKTEKVQAGAKRYAFAPLPEILDIVRPVLGKHGIALLQETLDDGNGRVGAGVLLMHSSGEFVAFDPLMLAAPGDPQSAGSAITYARRYTLCAALGIAADADDDGAKATRSPADARGSQRDPAGTPFSAGTDAAVSPSQSAASVTSAEAEQDVGESEAFGEGATGSPATTEPLVRLWQSLDLLAGGYRTRAIAAVNTTTGKHYTKATAEDITTEELERTVAKFSQPDAPVIGKVTA